MKTRFLKASETERKWWIVDAKNVVLGRLASQIALRLRGKHKPSFTPHMDCGDGVVVINAGQVRLTGDKLRQRKFHWHTGYPGGIKSRTMKEILGADHPERVVYKAVQRMISRNILGRDQMSHLRVYKDANHQQEAQNPEKWDFSSMNRKNTQREEA